MSKKSAGKEVYVVSHYYYDSDFDTHATVYIEGIYENREKAEAYVNKQFLKNSYSIKAVELNKVVNINI